MRQARVEERRRVAGDWSPRGCGGAEIRGCVDEGLDHGRSTEADVVERLEEFPEPECSAAFVEKPADFCVVDLAV